MRKSAPGGLLFGTVAAIVVANFLLAQLLARALYPGTGLQLGTAALGALAAVAIGLTAYVVVGWRAYLRKPPTPE